MLEDKNQSRTSLDQLGEFGLINHITKHFKISHVNRENGSNKCMQYASKRVY